MKIDMKEDIHVIPSNDIEHHHVSRNCPCRPFVDDECDDVIVHNAFDGREILEALENEQEEGLHIWQPEDWQEYN